MFENFGDRKIFRLKNYFFHFLNAKLQRKFELCKFFKRKMLFYFLFLIKINFIFIYTLYIYNKSTNKSTF